MLPSPFFGALFDRWVRIVPVPRSLDHIVLPWKARLISSLLTYWWLVILQISPRKYYQVDTWPLSWARDQVGFLINHPFSKNLCWIPWASWLSWTTTWRVERWKVVRLSSFQRDILVCVCVCWRKMIFSSIVPRDWLLNLLSCPNLDLNVGYRQVKWEPTMFIMLSYSWLFPRAYTVISFGPDQCYHLVHIIMEFHLHGNLDDLLLIPSTVFSSYPWFMLNIKLVLETLKAFLHASSWSICLV